jgi:hypothetical protein
MLIKLIPNKSAVAAGTQFVVRPQIGPTYEVVDFYLTGGLTKAMIKNFRVEVRGKPIQTFKDGVQMDALNKAWRRPESGRDDLLRLWFYRPELENLAQARNFALGTQDVDTLAFVMDIDASAPVAANMVVKARTTAPMDLGVMTKIKQFPQNFAQGGEQEIADLPTRGAAIAAMHLQSAEVESLELALDSYKVLEGKVSELHDSYAESLTPQAGFAHVSYLPRKSQFDALVTEGVQDFRLTVGLANAASFPLVVEYFDSYDGL